MPIRPPNRGPIQANGVSGTGKRLYTVSWGTGNKAHTVTIVGQRHGTSTGRSTNKPLPMNEKIAIEIHKAVITLIKAKLLDHNKDITLELAEYGYKTNPKIKPNGTQILHIAFKRVPNSRISTTSSSSPRPSAGRSAAESVAEVPSSGQKRKRSSDQGPSFSSSLPPPPARTHAAARSDPPGKFIIDRGAGGDCAAFSLLHQLQQRGIQKPDGTRYTSQQQVRNFVSNYLNTHVDKISNEVVGNIYQSLCEAEEAGIRLPPDLKRVLAEERASLGTISPANKIALVQEYAKLIDKSGFWLDKGFFEIAATAFGTQIAIIRTEPETSTLGIYEIFPRTSIDPSTALFIYFNGIPGQSYGNHFQSIELKAMQRLSSLVNKDRETKVDNFITGVNDQKVFRTQEEQAAGISRNLIDLQTVYPDAYRAVLTLVSERLRTTISPGAHLTGEMIRILFAITKDDILQKIRS